MRAWWFGPGCIVGAVSLIYAQMLTHRFVNYDDPVYITDNAQVLRGLSLEGVRWAFSTCLTGMWHPLTWISLMANVTFFGPEATGFHAVNVTLHALSALTLYATLVSATGAKGRSLLAALLFAVHPLNVESVAWASQRKSTLSTLLCFLAILAWTRYYRSGSYRAYGVALIFFGLGLLAKPMLVSLPVIFLCFEIWNAQGKIKACWPKAFRLVPFFGLSAISGWICLHPFGPTDVAAADSRLVVADLLNVPRNVVTYLGRLLRPVDLAVYYPSTNEIFFGLSIVSMLGLLGITWWVVKSSKPMWTLGWAWFFITLLPVSGVIAIGSHATADRYVYLPAVGIFVAIAWSVPSRGIWLGASAVLVVAWGALAYAQVGLWRDSATLWRHTIGITTPNFTQMGNLAGGLIENGRDDEALFYLKKAFELNPAGHRTCWMNLAYLYDHQGKKLAALEALQKAVRLAPGDPRIHNHLGAILHDLGRGAEAEVALREAMRLNPDYAAPWVNIGVLWAGKGDLRKAIEAFEHALQIEPFAFGARENLARAQTEVKALEKAKGSNN